MRWALLAAVALALLGGGAYLILGAERVEHFFKDETAPFREPEGEWIPDVPGKRAELWSVGDSGPGGAEGVVALIREADPDRILYVGDVYPGGTPSEYREWDAAWGAVAERTAPTPGNHEWPDATEGYDPYWERVRGEPPPTYYSFEAGGWEVLVLNSEHEEQDAQAEWLRGHGGGTCRVAVWHRPRYSAGPRGDEEEMDAFWQAARGRARIVISGHEHNMQRLKPRNGMVQFVSGAGGYGHHPMSADDPRLAFGDAEHDGALRLSLSPGRAAWQFVGVGGGVLDSGSLRCRS